MEINRKNKKIQDISMIPMINIIFLMLIFFLVSGTIAKVEIIPVEIPEASSSKLLDEGHIVIVVGYHRQILVNDDLVDEPSFEAVMTTQLRANPRAVITLKADARLPASVLIDMMEKIRRAGGKNLSLVTQS